MRPNAQIDAGRLEVDLHSPDGYKAMPAVPRREESKSPHWCNTPSRGCSMLPFYRHPEATDTAAPREMVLRVEVAMVPPGRRAQPAPVGP